MSSIGLLLLLEVYYIIFEQIQINVQTSILFAHSNPFELNR